MFDLLLTGALAALQGALGGMGLYVALRPPGPSTHRRWIIGFGAVTFAGVVLTLFIAARANGAQEQLNRQLIDLRVNQATEEGEVRTTREIMEGIAKTGIPGLKEFATAVLGAIQVPKQASSQNPVITNAQLCQRATSLAQKIRSFEGDFNSHERTETENWIRQMAGKTQTAQLALEQSNFQQKVQREQTHREEFVDRYLSDAKYDHDQIIDRLPAAKRDELTSHNGEAETMISVGHLVGAVSGYGVANYLDELAKTLCSK